MSEMRLWLVEVHDDDFEYDCFESGIVWADNAEEAIRLTREGAKYLSRGDRTRLVAKPAPMSGIVDTYNHPG